MGGSTGLLDRLDPATRADIAALTAAVAALTKTLGGGGASSASPFAPQPAPPPTPPGPAAVPTQTWLENYWTVAVNTPGGGDSIQVAGPTGQALALGSSSLQEYAGCLLVVSTGPLQGWHSTVNEVVNQTGTGATLYLNDTIPAGGFLAGDRFAIMPAGDQAVDVRTPLVLASVDAGDSLVSYEALFSGTWNVLLFVGTTTVLNLQVTPSGSDSVASAALNGGAAVTAGVWIELAIPVSVGANYAITTTSYIGSTSCISISGSKTTAGLGGGVASGGGGGGGGGASTLVKAQIISNQAADTNFASFTPLFPGVAKISISLATNSILNWVTTVGESSTTDALINGQSIANRQLQNFAIPVDPAASYALQVATTQSGNLMVSILEDA